MNIIDIISRLTAGQITLAVVAILSLIQITPIRIDPWSALFKLIGKQINGDLEEKIDQLSEKVDRLEAKEDERDAVNRRLRILAFEDELLEGRKHTKERFDQVLQYDTTGYKQYCSAHPEFQNDHVTASVEHIRKVYAERLERRDFL